MQPTHTIQESSCFGEQRKRFLFSPVNINIYLFIGFRGRNYTYVSPLREHLDQDHPKVNGVGGSTSPTSLPSEKESIILLYDPGIYWYQEWDSNPRVKILHYTFRCV